LELEASTKARGARRRAASLAVIAALLSFAPAHAARPHLPPNLPPNLPWPLEIEGSQYAPVAWADIPGWIEDDHRKAFTAFRESCKPINARPKPPADAKPIAAKGADPKGLDNKAPEAKGLDTKGLDTKGLGTSLRDPCRAARIADVSDDAKARAFFEENFQPLRISRLGEGDGFVTGYYEPIIDGSRTQTDVYSVPVYRRPSNLFVRGFKQDAPSLPNKGQVFRKIGRRKLVPYYDRAEIEDGVIAGRGLEICWLKNQTDLLFAQIQGSARVRFEDGSVLRINYDAHNGFPYTAVGRILIERNIIPKDQMSMQRIRQWMEENPDGAKELRRQNRSYVFFREVQLSDKDEAVGAQGVPLTPGRSIAVDKSLHVYGTPFFIEGELPIESEQSKTPFRHLMVAQDTGSAIVGPARADIYFGAGADAGRVSGRLRHTMRFVILVPKSLDPVVRGRAMPLPGKRPSAKIAKLFPQTDPLKDQPNSDSKPAPAAATAKDTLVKDSLVKDSGKSTAAAVAVPTAPVVQTPGNTDIAKAVPLPEARPNIESSRPVRRHRHDRRYRHIRSAQ
jgi:membrane-bound lytic murein transglycosylase A